MQKLAKREEQIMQVFWALGKAFIKEVIPELPVQTTLQFGGYHGKDLRRQRFLIT